MNKTAQLFHQVLDETPESLETQVQLSFEVSELTHCCNRKV